MKRLIAVLMALVLVFSLAACATTAPATTDVDEQQTEGTTTWKSKMANFTFKDGIKVVFFQNYIRLNQDKTEDGKVVFPDFGDAMNPTTMTIAGVDVKAYPLDRLLKIWSAAPKADLKVIDESGKEYTMPAADLSSAYAGEYETEVDGVPANRGVLKAGSLEVKDFKYIISEDGNAFAFLTTGEAAADKPVKLPDLLSELGWPEATEYRMVCFDNFWNFIDMEETPADGGEDGVAVFDGTEIRATLSGSLNCSIPFETRGGSGKMNDLFFIAITDITDTTK